MLVRGSNGFSRRIVASLGGFSQNYYNMYEFLKPHFASFKYSLGFFFARITWLCTHVSRSKSFHREPPTIPINVASVFLSNIPLRCISLFHPQPHTTESSDRPSCTVPGADPRPTKSFSHSSSPTPRPGPRCPKSSDRLSCTVPGVDPPPTKSFSHSSSLSPRPGPRCPKSSDRLSCSVPRVDPRPTRIFSLYESQSPRGRFAWL